MGDVPVAGRLGRKHHLLVIGHSAVLDIVDQQLISIVVTVTAQDMFHIKNLEGHAGCSQDDRQQVVYFSLPVLHTPSTLPLLVLTRQQPQLSRNREIAECQQQHLLDKELGSVVTVILFLVLSTGHWKHLHGVPDRIVSKFIFQNIVTLASLLAIL